MLHLARRVSLGVDVGDLLQLERSLEGHRVVNAPAQEEKIAPVGEPLGCLADPVALPQQPAHQLRRAPDFADDLAGPCRVEEASGDSQPESQKRDGRELGREGLRGSDPDLDSRPRVDDPVSLPGDGATHDIADGHGAAAALTRRAQSRERVGRLAGLRDRNREHATVEDRLAVPELRGDVHLRRQAREGLHQALADEGGVV